MNSISIRLPYIVSFILIGLCVMNYSPVFAQKTYLGVRAGVLTEGPFRKDFSDKFDNGDFLSGAVLEYIPNKAMFSVSGEIQYISKTLLSPIALNIILGKKIKVRFTGGVVPLFRFAPIEPNKTIEMGLCSGLGLDFLITTNLVFSSNLRLYLLPSRKYHYSHIGSTDIDLNFNRADYLNFGLSYLIN